MNALILVDIQYDFMPGGALAVTEGDQVVKVANRMMPFFEIIFATQDWHPRNHLSFASQHIGKSAGEQILLGNIQQTLWPDHCVQNTQGAKLHLDLEFQNIHHVVQKGTHRKIDSYSGFFDNDHAQSTGLDLLLSDNSVDQVAVMGLATDYCVKYTALDAIGLGIETSLIIDGCRGVDLNHGDIEKSVEEMKDAGVQIITSEEWIKETASSES